MEIIRWGRIRAVMAPHPATRAKDPVPALLAAADLVFFAGEDLDDLVFFAGEEVGVLLFLGGAAAAEEGLVVLFLGGAAAAAEEVLVLLFLEADVFGAATDVEATLFLDLEDVCVGSLVGARVSGAEAVGTLGGLWAIAAIEEPTSE